jgi:methionyl-tRNA formyltransferase
MKTIFWGTPEAAVPFLEYLLKHQQVAAVVTQPDKPAHRGKELQKSPIKLFAEKSGIPVLQPADLKDAGFISKLKEFQAEAGIVIAYGRILPAQVISTFPKGLYNIHFSLLPQLRGAAPIQWAILGGLKKTGVCSFKISETLDTGEIFAQREVELTPDETTVTLEQKLISPGIKVLEETLQALQSGRTRGEPQLGNSTYAPKIQKENAKIDWRAPAVEIDRKIRALIRLGAFCIAPNGKILKILSARPLKNSSNRDVGTVADIDRKNGFVIKCGVGNLLVTRVQPEGKKEMNAGSYLQGHALKPGDCFGGQ